MGSGEGVHLLYDSYGGAVQSLQVGDEEEVPHRRARAGAEEHLVLLQVRAHRPFRNLKESLSCLF